MSIDKSVDAGGARVLPIHGAGGYFFRMLSAYQNWRARHRHPVSLVLHVVAIPMLPWAGVLAVVQLIDGAWSLWWRPVGLLIVSYFLQWIGHRIEGNDMGEVILFKRLLGRPYVAIAPDRRSAAREAPRYSVQGTK